MTEFSQGLLGTAALAVSVIYSMLQWFGGRDKDYLGIRARTWGRLIAPLFFGMAVIGLATICGNFRPWHLVAPLAYVLSTHVGYGGETLITKILRRSVWALVRTSCSVFFVLGTGRWNLFIAQVLFALVAANLIGIRNTVKAPQEEGLINFSSTFLAPFMIL